ncbi:MAG: hypothetical protein OEV99_08645 [Nitrospira sp.]|nr:hypothetical protein [Nitrospira sp.]MDH4369903.1 hypothetical protein [Nitrospira sp.]MDH5497357.1 hypothetical protein [Nitrospira sp.]MDH5726290.1 hypothetical protein [Nitrospira sp.]
MNSVFYVQAKGRESLIVDRQEGNREVSGSAGEPVLRGASAVGAFLNAKDWDPRSIANFIAPVSPSKGLRGLKG